MQSMWEHTGGGTTALGAAVAGRRGDFSGWQKGMHQAMLMDYYGGRNRLNNARADALENKTNAADYGPDDYMDAVAATTGVPKTLLAQYLQDTQKGPQPVMAQDSNVVSGEGGGAASMVPSGATGEMTKVPTGARTMLGMMMAQKLLTGKSNIQELQKAVGQGGLNEQGFNAVDGSAMPSTQLMNVFSATLGGHQAHAFTQQGGRVLDPNSGALDETGEQAQSSIDRTDAATTALGALADQRQAAATGKGSHLPRIRACQEMCYGFVPNVQFFHHCGLVGIAPPGEAEVKVVRGIRHSRPSRTNILL